MSSCRSCGAAVVWARTTSGKLMPVDAEPTPDGTLELVAGNSPTPGVVFLSANQRSLFSAKRYTSHFATCPNAQAHRKPR